MIVSFGDYPVCRIIKIPFAEYQQVQKEQHYPGIQDILIHPFGDPAVMAGSATIALEILEDLPDVNIVLAPFGGAILEEETPRGGI